MKLWNATIVGLFFTKSILNGTFQWLNLIEVTNNSIGGVMVCMFTSSAVDHGFKPRSGQTKYYKVGICCFSACSINEKEQRLLGSESK
jgi:hypothetical protein